MHWLGLDIGGANVKLADGLGYADSQPFPLWDRPDDLSSELRKLIARAPRSHQLAVTMTGELADCFQTKVEGVHWILDAVEQAAEGRRTYAYSTRGEFETTQVARRRVDEVAAANWHAVALFSGRFAPTGEAMLIDVGSTTCDIIPLRDGVPHAMGANDTERLLAGELVYSGVTRTPICGLVSHIPWRGISCPVAREWFATTRDVYLLTGDIPEEPADCVTADGRPASIEAARTRLARMVCADATDLRLDDAVEAASGIADSHATQIASGVRQVVARVGQPPGAVIVSGAGEFLARRAIQLAEFEPSVISLQDKLGDLVSCCAPAHAVAVLAAEGVALA